LTIKGPGMVGIRATQSGNENWFPAEPVMLQIQIGKAELEIKAHDQFRKTSESNPELTYDLTGFVNGENNSSLLSPVNITTTADTNSPAGTYPIVPQEVNASNYFLTYLKSILSNDVSFFTIGVFYQGNKSSTVWIVFNTRNFGRNTHFVTLEIDDSVTALVTTALVPNHDAARIITAGFFTQRSEQAFFRRRFCNRLKGGNRALTLPRSIRF